MEHLLKEHALRPDADHNDKRPRKKLKHADRPARLCTADNSSRDDDSNTDEQMQRCTTTPLRSVSYQRSQTVQRTCITSAVKKRASSSPNKPLVLVEKSSGSSSFCHVSRVLVLLYRYRARNQRIVYLMRVAPWWTRETCSTQTIWNTSRFYNSCFYRLPSELFHCSRVLWAGIHACCMTAFNHPESQLFSTLCQSAVSSQVLPRGWFGYGFGTILERWVWVRNGSHLPKPLGMVRVWVHVRRYILYSASKWPAHINSNFNRVVFSLESCCVSDFCSRFIL